MNRTPALAILVAAAALSSAHVLSPDLPLNPATFQETESFAAVDPTTFHLMPTCLANPTIYALASVDQGAQPTLFFE